MKKKKPTLRHKKIYETLINSPVFWFAVKKTRSEIISEKDKFRKEKLLISESKRIVENLHLPSEWITSVKECLKTGRLVLPTTPNCQIIFTSNYQTGKTELFLKIFKKTTLENIKKAWDSIKKFQKALPEIEAKEISEQELKVYEWRKEGKSPKWIISESGGRLIWLTENTVNQIYSRTRKLIGEHDTKNP